MHSCMIAGNLITQSWNSYHRVVTYPDSHLHACTQWLLTLCKIFTLTLCNSKVSHSLYACRSSVTVEYTDYTISLQSHLWWWFNWVCTCMYISRWRSQWWYSYWGGGDSVNRADSGLYVSRYCWNCLCRCLSLIHNNIQKKEVCIHVHVHAYTKLVLLM